MAGQQIFFGPEAIFVMEDLTALAGIKYTCRRGNLVTEPVACSEAIILQLAPNHTLQF
jgi:hypothetical protein